MAIATLILVVKLSGEVLDILYELVVNQFHLSTFAFFQEKNNPHVFFGPLQLKHKNQIVFQTLTPPGRFSEFCLQSWKSRLVW